MTTSLGTGRHGYIGILLDATTYLAYSSTAEESPCLPTYTQFVIMDRNHLRARATRQWTTFDQCHQAFNLQLLTAVKEVYFGDLHHDVTGFSDVSIAEMLTCARMNHLWNP